MKRYSSSGSVLNMNFSDSVKVLDVVQVEASDWGSCFQIDVVFISIRLSKPDVSPGVEKDRRDTSSEHGVNRLTFGNVPAAIKTRLHHLRYSGTVHSSEESCLHLSWTVCCIIAFYCRRDNDFANCVIHISHVAVARPSMASLLVLNASRAVCKATIWAV